MSQRKTFTGFGLGAIQTGLFLHEAHRSGNFARFVVSEVMPEVIGDVRKAEGTITINVAHADHIEVVTIPNVTVLDPQDAGERAQLVTELVGADEIATALPSVDFYTRGNAFSPTALLADSLTQRGTKPGIIYTAENDTRAAEKLAAAMTDKFPPTLQPIDTVIGKMCGTVTDAPTIRELNLATFTPFSKRAVLVEAYNRIQIERIKLPGFQRGIEVFEEKDDLAPFEDAKLYGHNAVHAMLGYLANERNIESMDQVRNFPKLLTIARAAFLEECGPALRHRHCIADSLFTENGWQNFSDELLTRMTNPFLRDAVDRVIRDPRRKLGWDDRLVGAIRLCVAAGVEPTRLARGVRAAMQFGKITDLASLWPEAVRGSEEAGEILARVGNLAR